MQVWSSIFNVFAIVILLYWNMAYVNTSKVLEKDFDQARLNQAVEYATEAMFQKTIEIEDIDIDYTNMNSVLINPSDSIDIFESLMCFSYNMSPSEENKKHVEHSIAAAILSSGDGFYIAEEVEDDITPGDANKGGDYVLKWGVKKPYTTKIGNKTYGFNIDKDKWVSVDSSGHISIPSGVGFEGGMTHDSALMIANQQINKAIIHEIERKNLNRKAFEYKFYLPSVATKDGVNPITGPGVLMLVQALDFASTERIDAISVSGFKTRPRIQVIGFTDIGGRKYYCYDSQMDPADIGTRFTTTNIFRSIEAAANAGYAPHYQLLAKKITKR